MAFHIFHINEVYSNADGSIQYIEFLGEQNNQHIWGGQTLTATQGGPTNSFTFPTNLPNASTLNKSVLVATPGYVQFRLDNPELNLPAADYVLPFNGFLFTSGGVTVNFPSMDSIVIANLPRDGVNSVGENGITTALNSPRNFAGQTGTIVLGNSPPVVSTALADQVAGSGQEFEFTFAANAFTDPNSDPLTYEAFLNVDEEIPAWLTFDSGTRTFSGTPAPENAGPYNIRVVASDAEDDVADVFVLTVLSGQILSGSAVTGTAGNDSITGTAGNDSLDGAAGNDTMAGGAGNDTYVVDSVLDVVTEAAGQGSADLVESSVSLTLVTNVENLTLTGGENINGTGNAANNTITGNSGNNSLDGLAGDDSMSGGAGNDTYTVDSGGDSVTEGVDAGVDTVLSSVSRTLGANQEILVLGGIALNGTGNSGANTITGNGNDNFLNGAGGADSMEGGNGNDVFVVDDPGDIATDSGTGTDRVESTVSFTIGPGIEHLTLMGGDQIDGTGNDTANILRGNTAANSLSGGGGDDTLLGLNGDDTLDGGAGADRLDGGQGADAFVFADASAADTIRDFHSGEDEIRLDNDVFTGIGGPGPLSAEDVQFGLRSAITATSGGGNLLKFATDTGELFYDADGAGNGGPLLIFTIMSCSASGTTLDLGAAQDLVVF